MLISTCPVSDDHVGGNRCFPCNFGDQHPIPGETGRAASPPGQTTPEKQYLLDLESSTIARPAQNQAPVNSPYTDGPCLPTISMRMPQLNISSVRLLFTICTEDVVGSAPTGAISVEPSLILQRRVGLHHQAATCAAALRPAGVRLATYGIPIQAP